MTNKQVARYLKETAQLIELTGGNPFRARAFENGARKIEQMNFALADWAEDNTLTELDGIGKGLASQIAELLDRGSFDLRDELTSSVPPGLIEVLRIKGLGAKKVRKLWKELEITTVDELEAAAGSGLLADIDGFGSKTQDNILLGIEHLKRYQSYRRFADVYGTVEALLARFEALEAFDRIAVAGDIRRRMEVVSSVEIVVAPREGVKVQDTMASVLPLATETPSDVERAACFKTMILGDLPLAVYCVKLTYFESTLWQLTGSPEHVRALVEAFGRPDDEASEAGIYASRRLAYIEPELRENMGELQGATNGTLPRLVTISDLKGILHNHTTYSDGAHSLREMVEKTREMGYSYFGVSDHSRSLAVANGLSIESVYAQQDEINRLNLEIEEENARFRIFSGIESDILSDGSLDYPNDVLTSLDFVVASVHSRFGMPEKEMTKRVIKAVEHPCTRILGHPTGRLLLIREGYQLNLHKVIEACAANHVAIEINANPRRLDLDWRWVRRAADRGILIAINPDAHSVDELKYLQWGTMIARKGWLTAEQCLNAKTLEDFANWIASGK